MMGLGVGIILSILSPSNENTNFIFVFDSKAPPEKDEEREHAGWIEFLYGTPQMFIDPKYPVKPHVGQIFFFPAWLLHEVYPFRGKGLRRTISFNLSF